MEKYWMNVELLADKANEFRKWLDNNGIYCEPSDAGYGYTHFECRVSPAEAKAANTYLDYLEGNADLLYAEKHGIIEYTLEENGMEMFYYTSFPSERATYKATVDLRTGEEKREKLAYYYPPYKAKIGGKYYANCCA